ncbi:MAG: hypothetical protein FGM15_03425 [Chthoniobacterales bacterium]|nr:hypothetical protein [Chthoniobacterales bacterium]
MDKQTVTSAIVNLSKRRPVFHSEADLQHAFAWELASTKGVSLRLEVPLPDVGEVDLLIPAPATVIEFKYKTAVRDITISEENFALKQHGAQPLGRYDVLKDLSRVEKSNRGGFVLFITSDASYWGPCRGNGSSFSLHQGRAIHGRMAWENNSNKKSLGAKRVHPITISGSYICEWNDYSREGEFRYLLFSIKRL